MEWPVALGMEASGLGRDGLGLCGVRGFSVVPEWLDHFKGAGPQFLDLQLSHARSLALNYPVHFFVSPYWRMSCLLRPLR